MTVLNFKISLNNGDLWDNLFLYCFKSVDHSIQNDVCKPVSQTLNESDNLNYLKSPDSCVAIYRVGQQETDSSSNLLAVEKLIYSNFRNVSSSLIRESGDTSDIDQSFVSLINRFATALNVSKEMKKHHPCKIASGYAMSQFFRTLVNSLVYRKLVMSNFVLNRGIDYCKPRKCYCVNIKLQNEGSFIDHEFFVRIERLYIERRELDNIMSWLSTLGGGFSALGEYQPAFAYKAGQISCDQMKLALRLGDELVVSRCKLYFSLSLIQRGYLKLARKIIEEQFKFATNHIVYDQKLVNMCKGIWAKLKYEHRMKCNRKKIK